MTLGDILAQLGEHLYRLWPLRILNEWECGFKLTLGKAGGVLRPGLQWIWPFIQELIMEEQTREIDQTYPVTLQTSDGKTYSVILAAEYRIADVHKMYLTIRDHDQTVMNRIAASIGTCGRALASDDLAADLPTDVYDDCCDDLATFGIELLGCETVSIHPVRALRLITGE